MMVAIGFAGYHIDFDLDQEACTWTPIEKPDAPIEIDEETFPIIGCSDDRRYVLYGDGTYVAVDLPIYDVYAS